MNPPKFTDLDTYKKYLAIEPKAPSATRLSDAMDREISHDAIMNGLENADLQQKDMFFTNIDYLYNEGLMVSCDDTIIDKPHSNPKYNDLVSKYYSGRHHKVVLGICLVTLYATDSKGLKLPINFRVVDPREDKTKHDLMREMFLEVQDWGANVGLFTADSWYASLDNMKFLTNNGTKWLFGLEKNRIVSEEAHCHVQVSTLNIPNEGKKVHLKGYGFVRVFSRDLTEEIPKYYVCSDVAISEERFTKNHKKHWGIENYHRSLKQFCSIGGFLYRKTKLVFNHIYCSISTFSLLSIKAFQEKLTSVYEIPRKIQIEMIKLFIVDDFLKISYTPIAIETNRYTVDHTK